MCGLWDRIDTSKTRIISGVAALELSLRGIGGVTLADLIDLIVDGILVTFAVALSSGWTGQTLGTLATWLLYALVLYTSLPKLFPAALSEVADDGGIVGLIVVGSVALAFPVQALFNKAVRHERNILGYSVESGYLAEALLLFLLLWSVLFCLYLGFVRSGSIFGDDSAFRRLVIARDESGHVTNVLVKDSDDRTLLDRIILFSTVGMLGLSFGIVVLGTGILIAALWLFYPIPELLFVTATIGSIVPTRADRFELPVGPEVDLEQDIGAGMFLVLKSDKGMGIAYIMMVGLVMSMSLYLIALFYGSLALSGFIKSLDFALTSGPPTSMRYLVGEVAGVGAAVTLTIAATLLLWVWVRLAKRSVAFTTAWNANQGAQDLTSSPPTVSRPPGGAAVPMVLAITAAPVVFTVDGTQPLVVVYGVFWPVSLLGAGLWVRYTFRHPPQPAHSDNMAYPISHFFILLTYMVFTAFSSEFEISVAAMIVGGMTLLPYFDPELKTVLKQPGSPWNYLVPWRGGIYVVLLVGFALAMPQYATVGVFGALACLVATVLAVLVDWRSGHTGS